MKTTTLRIRRRRRLSRGMSLIEGLMASMVLLVGLVGVLQGLITAAQQNSVANRVTRAGAITRQTVLGLEALGRTRLEGAGGLFLPANCLAAAARLDGAGRSLVDGLDGVAGFSDVCVVDIDTYDTAAAVPAQTLPLATYPAFDQAKYRRMAVYLRNTVAIDPDNKAFLAVVVSWTDLGRRFYHTEYLSFYDSTINQTGVEL